MSLLDKYLDYCAPLLGSVNYNRWSFLTVLSAVLERRVWLDRKRQGIIYPNLYTILVGPPGNGKTFHAERAVRFVENICNDKFKLYITAERITSAALITSLKESERKQFLNGQFYKQCPVFIFSPELSRTIEDFGGGTLTTDLTDLYDALPLDGFRQKRTEKSGLVRLHNPNIVLLGCTTEETLSRASAINLVTSGLSSRIVFVTEHEVLPHQYEVVEEDETLKDFIKKEMNNLFNLRGSYKLSDSAQKIWIGHSEAARYDSSRAVSGLMQHYFARKSYQIYKVALLNCICNNRKEVIDEDIVKAISWLEEIEPNMIKAFGISSIEKAENLMQILERIIPPEPEFITKRQLVDKLYSQFGLALPLTHQVEGVLRSIEALSHIKTSTVGAEILYAKKV